MRKARERYPAGHSRTQPTIINGEQKHLFHHTLSSWLSIPKVTLYYFQQASRSYQCPSYQTITAMWSLTLHQIWLLWLILLTLRLFRLDSKQLCCGFKNSFLDYVSYCSEIAKPMWLWKVLVLPHWFTRWNNNQLFLLEICHCNGKIPVFHSCKRKSRDYVYFYEWLWSE